MCVLTESNARFAIQPVCRDKDSAIGTITDPSSLAFPTVVPPPDNRKNGTSGCTVTSTPASPLSGGAWWLLTGLVAWMGWNRRKSKQH
jgi:MYXO-CTERM domain-containing protein